jgi:hypothetical protein
MKQNTAHRQHPVRSTRKRCGPQQSPLAEDRISGELPARVEHTAENQPSWARRDGKALLKVKEEAGLST